MALQAVIILLAGCEGVAPRHLRTATSAPTLELKESFDWGKEYLFGNRSADGIARGVYRPVGQDAGGTFFMGPRGAITQKAVATEGGKPLADAPLVAMDGGIYLPNDSSQPAKIFIVLGAVRMYRNGTALPPARREPGQDIDLMSSQIAMSPNPVAAGVGAAIGYGIVAELDRASMGNFRIQMHQPDGHALRKALSSATLQAAPAPGPSPSAQSTPIPIPTASTPLAAGKDTYNAEKLARSGSCNTQPRATMIATGPGFETYSVPCADGRVWQVRCEFGNCSVAP
ncbi:hypothetical protein [Variovorax sp. WS11]|uniref:hypothetical protein n=1 Tax=Variovorax sp. WS11 TaxID=1105204 RepID=UPI0011B27D01|nr:hypothetical protein [Variovorax sp. WS11]